MELTAAFLAAQREGDPRRRVLVINPEGAPAHIEPLELRDARYTAAPADPSGYAALAQRLSPAAGYSCLRFHSSAVSRSTAAL